MKIILEVTSITVVENRNGPDTVFLNTTLPESTYPFESTGQNLKLDVAHGKGVEYVHKYFGSGCKIEVVNLDVVVIPFNE